MKKIQMIFICATLIAGCSKQAESRKDIEAADNALTADTTVSGTFKTMMTKGEMIGDQTEITPEIIASVEKLEEAWEKAGGKEKFYALRDQSYIYIVDYYENRDEEHLSKLLAFYKDNNMPVESVSGPIYNLQWIREFYENSNPSQEIISQLKQFIK